MLRCEEGISYKAFSGMKHCLSKLPCGRCVSTEGGTREQGNCKVSEFDASKCEDCKAKFLCFTACFYPMNFDNPEKIRIVEILEEQ